MANIALGEDQLVQKYLPDKGSGQKVRLWIPDGLKTIRGLIIDLGYPHGSDRADFQAFARANDFAVLGTLLRWPPELDQNLADICKDLGAQTKHPELENVPWIMHGFSRACGPCARVAVQRPEKVLAVLTGGSPGTTIDLKTDQYIPELRRIAVMSVNGSEDPFVGTMQWWKDNFPVIRSKHLPWGTGVQWGAGHGALTNFTLHSAFLKDVIRLRMPTDFNPTAGSVKLKDMIPEEQGWLGDHATWEKSCPTVASYADYKGEKEAASWLPGAYSAAVWRAYVVKNPELKISVTNGVARVEGDAPMGTTSVDFYDGDQLLSAVKSAPYELQNEKLAAGLHWLYAIAVGEGRQSASRPLMVYNGSVVPMGEETAVASTAPLALVEIASKEKATLKSLIEREQYAGPSDWKLAFTDDFSKEPNLNWTVGKLGGTLSFVDGAMQIEGKGQVSVSLPYDWPRDVAVEYRGRALSGTGSDVSVYLNGTVGTDRPWRDGVMFHFGAKANTFSDFQIVGEDTEDLGARYVLEKWHTVRFERMGDEVSAFIDGKNVGVRKLNANELRSVIGQRVGLYTLDSKAQFDDVKIYVRSPKDPGAVKPPMPGETELAELAQSLVSLLGSPYAEQRTLATTVLGNFSVPLQKTLRKIVEAGSITEPKQKEQLAQLIKGIRPE